jgi:hypothetical protein
MPPTIRLVAVGFALTTLGALTACGRDGAEARAPGGVADGRALYEQLVTQMYGTPTQRAAAEELGFLTAQHAIAACTATVGVTCGIPTYVAMDTSFVAPGDLLAFAPVRSDYGVGARIQRFAAAGEDADAGLGVASSAEENDRQSRALENCQAEAAYGDSLASGPPGQSALEGRFEKTLQAVQDRVLPDLPTDYASCMSQAGFDSRDLVETYLAVERTYPGVSYQQPSDVTKLPGWAEAVAFEHKAAAADAACRADAVDIAMAAARRTMTDFAAENETALAANAAAWKDVEEQLTELQAQLDTD